MKKALLLAAFIGSFVAANAQTAGYHSGLNYTGAGGANGFRTVSEENAFMEQMLADRRKKDREENGMTETKQVRVQTEQRTAAKRPTNQAKRGSSRQS